ncbi:MAG: acylphosphatase [Candidatus Hydrogenedentes bacterium]|jgi:acylphosphatase|nr:acylphosphatase [Candidatus Hydrogenedentota bacterium]
MRDANEKVRKVRANVKISGIVQGVLFRAYTCENAVRLGVTGWVRNLYDGRVEGLFEGDQEAVSQLISWCHKGPPGARVTDVEVEWGEYSREFDTFLVARSAGSFS